MLETHPQKMLQGSRKMLFRPGRHGISCIEGLRSSVRQVHSAKSIAAGCSKLFGLRAVFENLTSQEQPAFVYTVPQSPEAKELRRTFLRFSPTIHYFQAAEGYFYGSAIIGCKTALNGP
jgi:hypothetical protein